MASSILRLSMFLGKLPPEAFDAIFPHGPILSHRLRASELNPQPLPPKEQLLVASAAVAHDIAFAAISAEAAGTGSASKLVTRAVDDWCGTRPRPIPWPGPWPFPWPPEPEPHPDWDIGLSRVVGALTLASVASRLEEGELQEILARGAEQLLEAGLG